jgi:anti-anti-sigma regulatory factor
MSMATVSVWPNIDEKNLVPALQEVAANLESGDKEVLLDFSAVRRVDAPALAAIEALAKAAGEKSVKVVWRGVNVNVYRVLKLVKLAGRFSFV